MRRFLITGRFKGKVEVHYNNEGFLRKLDFAAAELSPDAIKWFKARTAVNVENIHQGFENHVTVEEAEFEVTFDDFKREYPRKRNTHRAEAYWPKLATGNKQYQAFLGAIAYAKHCNKKGIAKDFIMLPDRFLREEHYKNDWNE